MTDAPDKAAAKAAREAAKKLRLAQALRDNLKRRKAQGTARTIKGPQNKAPDHTD